MPTGTFARLQALLVEILGCQPAEVTLISDLVDDLGCDSIDLVELEMAIEDEFGFETDASVMFIEIVQDAIDYISLRATR